jgi:transcriptional regulator with XRE-family HTH domain
MKGSNLTQRELAERLGWSQPRISQILNSENLNLSTAADLAWALGYRFELVPVPAQREGTPAIDDPPPPGWVRQRAREILGRLRHAR